MTEKLLNVKPIDGEGKGCDSASPPAPIHNFRAMKLGGRIVRENCFLLGSQDDMMTPPNGGNVS